MLPAVECLFSFSCVAHCGVRNPIQLFVSRKVAKTYVFFAFRCAFA